jgi:hypothetical protein
MRQPEGSFGVQTQLSRISCQLSFPSIGKHVHRPLAWTTTALGIRSSWTYWRRPITNRFGIYLRRASGHSEELASQTGIGSANGPSYRPVVTIATAREVEAITEAVSVRITEVPLGYPRHP